MFLILGLSSWQDTRYAPAVELALRVEVHRQTWRAAARQTYQMAQTARHDPMKCQEAP